jgi:transmembrane sensor
MVVDDQTYRQLGRYLSRECSRTEARAVEAWAQGNPERESLLAGMRMLWETRGQDPPQWDADAGWQELDKLLEQGRFFKRSPATGIRLAPSSDSVLTQIQTDRDAKHGKESGTLQDRQASLLRKNKLASVHRPYGFRFWLVRAAAALLLVGFVTLLVRELAGPADTRSGSLALREVATEPGQRVSLHLDDGTRVRMNSGSVLRMPGTFSDKVRMVHLSGEAYFEVTGDARPFIVATDRGQMIEVLGTEFNVQSYRDEPFRVVVSGGVVSVHEVASRQAVGQAGQVVLTPDELQDSGQGIRLERGQMMTEQDGSVQVYRDVDLSRHLAWLEHRLVFEDTPLSQVARELERWYRVEVVLSEPAHEDLRVSATFENEPLYEVFRSLSLSLNLDYEIQGRQIVFSDRRP